MWRLIFLKFMRESSREVYLFLMLFLLCTVLFSAIWLNDSMSNAKEDAYNTIQGTIDLESNGIVLEQSKLAQLDEYMKKEPCVKGISSSAGGFANAVGMTTVKQYSGADPYKQKDDDDYWFGNDAVVVSGDYAVPLTEDFESKGCVLYKGKYPGEGEAMISQELAEKNNLEIGDSLTLESYHKETITLQVSGIYQTTGIFAVDENNSMGQKVFVFSPYNYIYTSLETGCKFEETEYSGNITVHYKNYHQYQNVLSWIENVPGDILTLSDYEITDDTAITYAGQLGQLNAMNHLTNILIGMVAILVICSWIIFICMYIKEWTQEQILFMVLGSERKSSQLFKLFVSTSYCIPAAIMGAIVARQIQTILLDWVFTKTQYKDTSVISSFVNAREYVLSEPDVSNHYMWIVIATLFLFFSNVIVMQIREKKLRGKEGYHA